MGLRDETGRLDVIVSPKVYEEQREVINRNGILACAAAWEGDGVSNLKA